MASMVAFFAETWSCIHKMWPSICQRRFFTSHVAGSMRTFTVYFFCRHAFEPEDSICVTHHSSIETVYRSSYFFVHRPSVAAKKHKGMNICFISIHLYSVLLCLTSIFFYFLHGYHSGFSLFFHFFQSREALPVSCFSSIYYLFNKLLEFQFFLCFFQL